MNAQVVVESLYLLFYCEIHELLRVQALQDRKETTMTLINLKDLEAHLWHAAHIITGPIDASFLMPASGKPWYPFLSLSSQLHKEQNQYEDAV